MLYTTCIEHLRTQPIWFLLISSLGFFTILKKSATFLNWVFITFIRDPKDLKSYGSWAMVTGSTDGIGKAFAYQLAKKGLNLILVSRNSSKLESVSKEFQAEFPDTQIKTIAFDFSTNILEGVKEIEEGIKGLEIGIFINNVGVSYPSAAYFHEVDEQVWMDIVRVNLEGTTWVSRAVLPGMLQRSRGAIVNIGSGAAIVVPSHPLYTMYAATKSYIDQLSRCLHVEYKHCGIDVQCQVPLYVATKMASDIASIKRSSLFVPSPDDYAEAAIRHMGYEARCTPYWSHWVQWCFASLLPEAILDSWRLSIGINRRQGKLLTP